MGKATQLKADTIFSTLRKEFNLLDLIKHKLPTGVGFHALTEAFIEVEGFSAMPEPTAESQQRCAQFMSQHASSSVNVPPPKSATASTQPRLWFFCQLVMWPSRPILLLLSLFLFKFLSGLFFPLLHFTFSLNCCLNFCFKEENGRGPNYTWWEAWFPIMNFVVLKMTCNKFLLCEEDIFPKKISSR